MVRDKDYRLPLVNELKELIEFVEGIELRNGETFSEYTDEELKKQVEFYRYASNK
ncbi:hypothetical protein [Staphylococcus equorum]|uniref:hypothetical protein n=1 Tax=Staphylococcus equorum TaxID=246432 RepID=UPI003CECDF06